ncbi:MAG: hypothetical protein H0V89_00995, partial [Deltaproteobacteria bacterium]|nr:hypothetical protein [Deltaproteobacteria bacterium]
MRYVSVLASIVCASSIACVDDGKEETGDLASADAIAGTPSIEILGTSGDGLSVPRDLEFHPDRPEELWVVNQETDGMVILFEPGTGTQTSEDRVDSFAEHFMEEVSSLAFGVTDDTVDDHPISTFGTCQESRNTYNDQAPPNDFMGPALWPGDLDLFAEVHQTGLGSHIDMLHSSPMCVGMAHDARNKYWVFDGQNGVLTWYDFQVPHGYGEDDHSDGMIRRYVDVALNRVPDVPGHIAVDDAGLLYIANTGEGQLLVVDPRNAVEGDAIPLLFEPLEEYTEYVGASVATLGDGLD